MLDTASEALKGVELRDFRESGKRNQSKGQGGFKRKCGSGQQSVVPRVTCIAELRKRRAMMQQVAELEPIVRMAENAAKEEGANE